MSFKIKFIKKQIKMDLRTEMANQFCICTAHSTITKQYLQHVTLTLGVSVCQSQAKRWSQKNPLATRVLYKLKQLLCLSPIDRKMGKQLQKVKMQITNVNLGEFLNSNSKFFCSHLRSTHVVLSGTAQQLTRQQGDQGGIGSIRWRVEKPDI